MRAIVFDFDGVIANSEPLHFQAFRDVLAPLGVTLTEKDYYATWLGFSDEDLFGQLSAAHGWTDGRIATLMSEKARLMEALEREHSMLFPGAAEAVRRAADAVPIAIASGALRHEIERVLERERLSSFFRAIVAAGDTPRSKPAPDPYLTAVARLSDAMGAPLAVADCVAVEDSMWGLASARAAGLRTVAVAHSYSPTELAGADLTIRSINELDLRALAALFSD